LRAIESIRTELEAQRVRWQSAAAELPDETWFAERRERFKQMPDERTIAGGIGIKEAARAEIEEAKRRSVASIEAIRRASDTLDQKLRTLDSLVTEDTRTLRDTLGLPNLDAPDLTDLLFGPRSTTALERMMYWVDLSRRRMPKGSRQGQLVYIASAYG